MKTETDLVFSDQRIAKAVASQSPISTLVKTVSNLARDTIVSRKYARKYPQKYESDNNF